MSIQKTSLLTALAVGAALSLSACQTTGSNGPNWVEVPQMQGQGMSVYYNKANIVVSPENANWRNAEIVSQASAPTEQNAQSHHFNITIDCAQASMRFNRITTYAKPNAQGEALNTQEGSEQFIPSREDNERALVQAICKP